MHAHSATQVELHCEVTHFSSAQAAKALLHGEGTVQGEDDPDTPWLPVITLIGC